MIRGDSEQAAEVVGEVVVPARTAVPAIVVSLTSPLGPTRWTEEQINRDE